MRILEVLQATARAHNRRLSLHTKRLNARAEDITEVVKAVTEVAGGVTELTRRIDKLVSRGHTGYNHRLALARRIKKLEERTLTMTDLFMEGDLALGKRLEELAGRVAEHEQASTADTEFLAARALSQKRRIEKLEEGVSLLETIMELHSQRLPDLSFLIARCNRTTEPAAQERNELTGWLVALQERISKLERRLEEEQ